MREKIIAATCEAIRSVKEPRLWETERGFQGGFHNALHACLHKACLLKEGVVLEMEYQKSRRHGMSQRPDIVLHVPSEINVKKNNFAVWALKHQATRVEAEADFKKLDEMFDRLKYPLGFFINIQSRETMRAHYQGQFCDSLICIAPKLTEGEIICTLA